MPQSPSLATEIEAMRKVESALSGLPPKARKRIITYILDEYMPPVEFGNGGFGEGSHERQGMHEAGL